MTSGGSGTAPPPSKKGDGKKQTSNGSSSGPSTTNPKIGSSSRRNDADDDEAVVKTLCKDWSLNTEAESQKRFWWNRTYSISIWEANITLRDAAGTSIDDFRKATDEAVWRGYILYQIGAVYKVCPICRQPEQNIDVKICCYCSATVHAECSVAAKPENIAWKSANQGFERYMCICHGCEDIKSDTVRPFVPEPDNARRAVIRALASVKEYPPAIAKALEDMRAHLNSRYGWDGSESSTVPADEDARYLEQVQTLVARYFQPGQSISRVIKRPIETKCGGLGVVAAVDIPKYTIIGVYPGYEDPLSGEQAKLDRPGPKYSLVDLNCADFFNNVFVELHKTVTPFINEPNVHETSNVAWIQEAVRPEGRLSVMSVRDIKAGEELLIGYGPLYPRTYPYNYDAYAYHQVEEHKDPPCFALWHWKSLDEKDANFVCYVGYDANADAYSYWETEDEANDRKGDAASLTTAANLEDI